MGRGKHLSKKEIEAKLPEITRLAEQCMSQPDIARIIGISSGRFSRDENIREAWLKGSLVLKKEVLKRYSILVKSGESWSAMKHYLAIQCKMVEPKEALIIRETSRIEMSDQQSLAIFNIMEKK